MKMVGKKILVHQAKTKEVSDGGIVMTAASIMPLPYGTVVAVGPEVSGSSDHYLGSGDIVLFNELGAISLGNLKPDHVLIEPDDILAILEEGEY